ncbi:MAG TPA: MFS transporter [Desulfomonilia bacterium]
MTFQANGKSNALRFIVLIGVVSLFADMTYEGARSITGPYLGSLGASATLIGIIAGLGELAGYGIRILSGYLSDRTKGYWVITIIGYLINLLAVPALALAGRWDLAACLVIAERIGKGIRNPARDAMLSHAAKDVGRGWGFGLHEALDQIGAVSGPLIVAAVLFFKGSYRTSFALLLIPALFAIGVLLVARFLYPSPKDMEPARQKSTGSFPGIFWLYLAGVGLIAAGYADYPLIAYHFSKGSSISQEWIPLFYAVAMGVDGLAAMAFGYLFDRIGFGILIVAAILSTAFAPLVFLGGFLPAMAGVVLWGIGMGAQESVMRAAVANMTSSDRRGTAYGMFNTGYGICWFVGSALMGYLYDVSVTYLVVFSVLIQLFSIPILLAVRRQWKSGTV